MAQTLCEKSDVLPQVAQFCRETAEYVAVHLDPHESRWVQHIRLHRNLFDNITTSVGESQNSALKKHGLQPNDQLHIAGKKGHHLFRSVTMMQT